MPKPKTNNHENTKLEKHEKLRHPPQDTEHTELSFFIQSGGADWIKELIPSGLFLMVASSKFCPFRPFVFS